MLYLYIRKYWFGNFPGGPVEAKIPRCQCRGPGSMPGQGTKSHMPQPKSGPAKQINTKKKKKKERKKRKCQFKYLCL